MTDEFLSYALKDLERRKTKKFDISEFLFKEQLSFVTDEARYATAVCSVRAGKTTACAADLINTAITMPGTTGLYITLARSSAKRICWPELLKINRDYKLGFEPNIAELTLTHPNGSIIYLLGANVETEIEKIRGLSNVALAYLDESQAFRPHIKELVEDIIAKRLYDTNGRCRIIGTPGPILAGYFYEASQGSSWSHHAWTMHQNPWLLKKSGLTPDQLIAQDCERRGITLDDPSIQRECFGRWKLDPNSLLLIYDPEVNDYDELPPDDYTYILGIDLGMKDADSLSLLAFSDHSPKTYLVEEILTPNQLTDDLAAQINKLHKSYDIAAMPADAGGLGLKIVEDLKSRYGLPLVAAEKLGKMANYKHLNNALRTGNFKAKKNSRFAQDCNILERNNEKSTPEKIVVKGHSDAVDSVLYAFKLSPAYAWTPPPKKPKVGTPEFDKLQSEQLFEGHVSRLEKERQMKDGDAYTWHTDQAGVPSWLKYDE